MTQAGPSDIDQRLDEHLHRAGLQLRRREPIDVARIQADLGDAYPRFQSLISSQMLLHGSGASDRLSIIQDRIDGYRVVGELGSGTTAVVYDAEDENGHSVAIKMLRPAWAAHKETRTNFVREGQLLSRASHPNLVGLRSVGECMGRPYLVLDRVNGRSLAHTEVPSDRAGYARFAESAAALVRGVAHMHQHGVVHRDIKPGNILVDGTDRWILADLGIAYDATTPISSSLVGTGTPGYVSPQQLLTPTAPPSPGDDIYAMGRTMLAALTPHARRTHGTESVRTGLGMPPAKTLPDTVPAPLKRILVRSMRTNPDERYPTAEALAADLGRTAAALSSSRHSTGLSTYRVGRTVPWKAMGLVTALAITAVGGAYFALGSRGAKLTIRSLPGAVATIDDGRETTLPHTFACEDGTVRVVVTAPRFKPRREAVRLRKGEHVILAPFALTPLDPGDTQATLDVLAHVGLPSGELLHVAKNAPVTRSNSEGQAAVLFYPRGAVAASLLDQAEFEWVGPVPHHAVLRWRVGDDTYETPLSENRAAMTVAIPPQVRESLTEGERLDWSVWVDERELAAAHCELAPPPATPPTSLSEKPNTILRRLERVLALRREGRGTAALRHTFGVPKSAQSPLLLRARMLVLTELCTGDSGLTSTQLWRASYYLSRDVESSKSSAGNNDHESTRPQRQDAPIPDRGTDEKGEGR